MRKPACVLVALLATFAAPAAAHAALVWSAPQTVSIAEQNGDEPNVAFDAAGNATAVWRENDGTHSVVRVATAAPGGFFTVASAPLSATGGVVASPQIAVAPDGSATALWMQQFQASPARYAAESSSRAAGSSTWSTPVNLTSLVTNATSLQVAMDASGNTLVAWALEDDLSDPGFGIPALQTRFRPKGGQFGGPLTVYQAGTTNTDEGLIGDVKLAFDEQGDALLAWDGRASSNNQDRFSTDIRASVRPAGGVFQTQQLLAQRGGEQETDLAAIAMHNGASIVAWNRSDGGQNEGDAESSYRPTPTGAWQARQIVAGSITTPGTPAFLSSLRFDSSGNALAALNVTNATPGQVALLGAGQSMFGTPTPALQPGIAPFGMNLGVDPAGTFTMAFHATTGTTDRVYVTSRTPGTGAWDAPQLGFPTETAPVLAVAPTGNAVAVWVASDGSNDAVQLSVGTIAPPPSPTPTPTPVPPPQPEPPVPSAIQLARPLTSEQATIATVAVSGDTTRLEWKIGSSGPTITGGVSGGVLQRSIRFRAPRGQFAVKVTAFGPGGSKSFSRTFSGPRQPTDSAAEKVLPHLEDAVYATGSQDVLTGKSSACGSVTIYAGTGHTLLGCFKPIDELTGIPSADRGVLVSLASALRLDPSDYAVMARAVELTDGYVANSAVYIDGTWPVLPKGGAAIVSFPQAHALTSANASLLVGGMSVGATPSGFNLTLDTSPGPISLGSIPPPAGNSGVGGFPFAGDFAVSLNPGTAVIRTTVRVSSAVQIAGNPIQAPVTLTATPFAINAPDGLTIGPYNVDFGLLALHGFVIRYSKASNTWSGQASACIFTDECIDMQPPDGGLVFQNGNLIKAAASFDYGDPGKPLAPGVFLENIGAGFGFNPTRLFGHARIGVGEFVKVDGRMVVAAPSSAAPYYLQRNEAGDAFPASYYTTPLTRPLIAMSADAILSLPVIGDTTLAGGYLLYEFPGFISVGGQANLNVLGIINYSGSVAGQYDVLKQAYNLHGDIRACLAAVHGICAGAVANFSRGPALQGGAGGCLKVGPVNIGGGVQWVHPYSPIIWPIDGCKWSRFKIDINPARAAEAGSPPSYPVTIKKGAPGEAVKLTGAADSPSVTITGPGGVSLSSTDKGIDYTPDGHLRIIRYDGTGGHFTTVGFDGATPGAYRIALQPGSAAVTQYASATNPPDAKVSGRVTGTGPKRVLHYDVLSRPDQTVQFSDVSGKDARVIGTITRGGSGTIRFNAAPGKKPRAIVAQFTLNDLAAETKTVTHYTPPPPTLPAPAHLALRRSKKSSKLTVTWRSVRDAVTYQLAVTTSDGRQRFVTTKRLRSVVNGITTTLSGRVTVRAVAPLREGKLAKATLKRAAPVKRAYQRLPKCTVQKAKKKTKLVCS